MSVASLRENFKVIRKKIDQAAKKVERNPDEITLVAVSKRKPASIIEEAFRTTGHCVFGENYLQEAQEKVATLAADVSWHFIGHIQSNKAKNVAELFDVVETLDRLKVAKALEKRLVELNKTLPVYIQVNIGRESQKGGVKPEDAEALVREVLKLPHLDFAGLMGMAPYYDEPEKSRPYFRELHNLAKGMEQAGLVGSREGVGLSMGMSGDFEIAVEEGATVVRVGTALFGERNNK